MVERGATVARLRAASGVVGAGLYDTQPVPLVPMGEFDDDQDTKVEIQSP